MNKTSIEWVKNPDGSQGYTWNPITGCLGPKGDGVHCPYCYARKLANTRLKKTYLANKNVAYCYERGDKIIGPPELMGKVNYSNPFYPRFWENRLLQAQGHRLNSGVFVCDMSDLFGIGIPEEWTGLVLKEIEFCNDCRFYLLTKQPQNLAQWSPFPPNCYVGVSVTDFLSYCKAMDGLEKIEATVKYLSFEPLLGDVGLPGPAFLAGIDWIICGAQTKPTVYPEISWVKKIVEAADRAGVPVFLKDNIRPLFNNNAPKWAFEEPLSWEIHRRLRQEMPKTKGD